MQVILKPVSHPDLGDIVVTEKLFPVGRGEDPFFAYDAEITAHLSRRHARIFVEPDGIYVADLGSRNGTQLNSEAVEFKPMRMRTGDRLSFASHLDYEVEILGQPEESSQVESHDFVLTLVPAEADSSLHPIAISNFPFLVGKLNPVFSEPLESRDNPDYLSRRHAHFFVRDGGLYIEDLQSTNGTTINGEALNEHARLISNGDLVLFGGNHFLYRVELKSPHSEAADVEAQEEECHTIHVSAANSFLDIFCIDDEEVAEEPPKNELPSADSDKKPVQTRVRRPGVISRVRTFTHEIKLAFGDGNGRTTHSLIVMAVCVLLALSLGAVYYYSEKPRRDMKHLLATGQYRDSAEMANRYLAEHPDNEEVRTLAIESFANYLVGEWQQLILKRDFVLADTLVEDARGLTSANTAGDAIVDILLWAGRLQQFIFERGGSDSPIRIFDDEEPMNDLLQWWDQGPDQRRSTMRLIVNYVPEFEQMNALVFSHLRSLRNEKSVYLTAIEKLKTTIEEKLEAGQPADLVVQIDNFSSQYPRLGGLDRLRSDLDAYLKIDAAIQSSDRLRAVVLVENSNFTTPPFIASVARLTATLLPSADVAQRYSNASAAWRAGKLAEALAILEELAGEPGGELARSELENKQKIIADYAGLQQVQGASDYGVRLMLFYNTLNPVEDSHFIQVLAPELERHRSVLEDMADQAWDIALQRWATYRESGGIRGLQRLEEEVSSQFRQQATLLTEAYDKASFGKQSYELLGREYSSLRSDLFRKVAAELALQRRSMEQLSIVLSPAILDAKLKMLSTADAGEMSETK